MKATESFNNTKAEAIADKMTGVSNNASMKKLTIFIVLICSLSGASCSSRNQSSGNSQTTKQETAQTRKLEETQAKETFAQWTTSETQKAFDYLKLGKVNASLHEILVGKLQENDGVVEVNIYWGEHFMFLEGKTATTIPGGNWTATFKQNDGKWFLIKVSGPGNFMRDNLMVALK